MIHDMDDDAIVVVPAPDHSYRAASVTPETAVIYYPDGEIAEDFGDEHNEDGGKRIKVLLVS